MDEKIDLISLLGQALLTNSYIDLSNIVRTIIEEYSLDERQNISLCNAN